MASDHSEKCCGLILYPTWRRTYLQCGIIVACKPRSVYILTDGRRIASYTHLGVIRVELRDKTILAPRANQFRKFDDGIVGILCRGNFDLTKMSAVEICEQTVYSTKTVHVFEGVEEIITEGFVTAASDPYQFSITNSVNGYSEYGSPVIDNTGMLVGMCFSFDHHLSARSILAIALAIQRSQNWPFTSIRSVFQRLYDII
ncbi:hypothetical protein ACP4OV_019423 [Aristida adscensionis]